jgi:hypothetical protein
MKRYLHFREDDAILLRNLGPRMERYHPEMAERFYAQIPHHPGASRVFTGGNEQVCTAHRAPISTPEEEKEVLRDAFSSG